MQVALTGLVYVPTGKMVVNANVKKVPYFQLCKGRDRTRKRCANKRIGSSNFCQDCSKQYKSTKKQIVWVPTEFGYAEVDSDSGSSQSSDDDYEDENSWRRWSLRNKTRPAYLKDKGRFSHSDEEISVRRVQSEEEVNIVPPSGSSRLPKLSGSRSESCLPRMHSFENAQPRAPRVVMVPSSDAESDLVPVQGANKAIVTDSGDERTIYTLSDSGVDQVRKRKKQQALTKREENTKRENAGYSGAIIDAPNKGTTKFRARSQTCAKSAPVRFAAGFLQLPTVNGGT